jgi:hypothetical protein
MNPRLVRFGRHGKPQEMVVLLRCCALHLGGWSRPSAQISLGLVVMTAVLLLALMALPAIRAGRAEAFPEVG